MVDYKADVREDGKMSGKQIQKLSLECLGFFCFGLI